MKTIGSQVVASAILDETNHLELVRTRANSTALLLWDGVKVCTRREVIFGQQTYRAADFDSHCPREMRLAQRLRDYRSADVLVNAIADIFLSLAGLTRTDADLAAFFAIATYFSDCQDPAPRAVVSATDEWEASRFLQLLTCFCRHALSLAIFDRALLWGLPQGCAPTFLLSDPAPVNSLVRFLNATQHHGFATARAGRSVSFPFSAVILDCDRSSRTTVPSSFCRIDATPHTRPQLPTGETLKKIEDKFQAQLLSYRLHNWSRVAAESCDGSDLGGSTRALASIFGSCFPGNQTMRGRARELLEQHDEDRRFDAACGEAAAVLEALLVLRHNNNKEVHVGEVAETANGILEMRGDGYQLEPRRVGAILKPFRLGRARDSKGYKFLLSAANQAKIHELGRSHEVSFFKGEIQQCNFCRASASTSAKDD